MALFGPEATTLASSQTSVQELPPQHILALYDKIIQSYRKKENLADKNRKSENMRSANVTKLR